MTVWPQAMPALITPFTPDGSLDVEGHEQNIAKMVELGALGVLIAGSTGEGPYLDPGERGALVRHAQQVAPGLVLLCGVFAESLRQAVRQVEEAAAAGADAALVVTPTTLVRGRGRSVEAFYQDLADTSALPILLYSVPRVTGWELPTESVARLALHPSIIGMKDSGGDPTRLSALADAIDEGFITYVGASPAILESHRRGVHGAITASANYALADVVAAVGGDGHAQERLDKLTTVIEEHGVAGTKFAAGLCGLTSGSPRRPLANLAQDAADRVTEAIRSTGPVSAQ
ncbi:MAG TPA: dihydrodipicolinate synthase family protein [Acidimicrobiia bacterium]|nr:dihydrodipicolinate synthase family protein [Acidimicrobiia bacterium]